MKHRVFMFILLLILLLPVDAPAQWVSQSIELQVGWNAVFVEVDPYPSNCNVLFDGLPIQSVWMYDQSFSSVQFVQDPNDLTIDNPEWRFYFPPGQPESFANNLFRILPNRAYLIFANEAFSFEVIGRPVWISQDWDPDTYTLTGFHVDPADPPSFGDWFGSSPAHLPLDIWEFGSNQIWSQIQNPSSKDIQSGKAYWVFTRGASSFQGPVNVQLPFNNHLGFTTKSLEQRIGVSSESAGQRNIQFQLLPSEDPPPQIIGQDDVSLFPNAGPVSLAYYGANQDPPVLDYIDFPLTLSFASDERFTKEVNVAVQVNKMSPASGNQIHQGLLRISDGKGYRRFLGVTFSGEGPTNAKGNKNGLASHFIGLWVGNVNLNKVSEPLINNPPLLTDTSSPFDFRIILHVDNNGVVRLLNEVTELWRNGTPTQPGRQVLMTPSAPVTLLNEIGNTVVASTLRDGRPFANRISTAMYSLLDQNNVHQDRIMQVTGTFGEDQSTLNLQLILYDRDPLNPFHHQFHAQHKYPVPNATPFPSLDYTITRNIRMVFSAVDPDGGNNPRYGYSQLGGFYEESITGLRRVNQNNPPVTVRGPFKIQRVSDVGVLNDGQ